MPANPKLSSEVHPGTKTFVLVSAVNFKKYIVAYNSVFYVTSCRLVATRYLNLVILGTWKIHILSDAILKKAIVDEAMNFMKISVKFQK